MENICLRRIGWRTWEMPEEILLELLTPQAGWLCISSAKTILFCLSPVFQHNYHVYPTLCPFPLKNCSLLRHLLMNYGWKRGNAEKKLVQHNVFIFETSFLRQKSVFQLSGPQSRGKKRLKTMGLVMGDWCLYPQINGRIDFPLFGVI